MNNKEERRPDSPKLNPEHYDEAYNYGYAQSVQNNPYADDYDHVMNASRHAEIEMRRNKDAIMERRKEYMKQLDKDFENMNKPEHKERVQKHKTKYNKNKVMRELLTKRKRTKSLGGKRNKNTKKNKKN